MVVIAGIAATFALVLLWAIYAERVPPPAPREELPRWQDFPSTADIRRAGFRRTAIGYDPKVVHQHLERVAIAFDTALTAREALEVLHNRDATADDVPAEDVPAEDVAPDGHPDG